MGCEKKSNFKTDGMIPIITYQQNVNTTVQPIRTREFHKAACKEAVTDPSSNLVSESMYFTVTWQG